MKITISKTTTIDEVKREFSAVYPYLKIEFYKKKFGQMVGGKEVLSNLQPLVREGSITINEAMKVKDLERLLDSDFLLIAQVFRRSGNIWLETSATDDWTLRQQNEHGREMTETPNPAESNEDDYELNRDQD